MRDHSVFMNELQSNNIVQLFDKGIEYEMAQMRANPEISKYLFSIVTFILTALTVIFAVRILSRHC